MHNTVAKLFRYTLALFEIAVAVGFSIVVPSSWFLLSALVGFSAIEMTYFRWRHVAIKQFFVSETVLNKAKHVISRRHFNSTAYEATRHSVHILDSISLPQFNRESELCTWICPRAISIQATNPVQKKFTIKTGVLLRYKLFQLLVHLLIVASLLTPVHKPLCQSTSWVWHDYGKGRHNKSINLLSALLFDFCLRPWTADGLICLQLNKSTRSCLKCMPQEVEKHALHIIDIGYFRNQHILDFGSLDFMYKRFGKPPLSNQHMLQHATFEIKNIGCKAQVQYKTMVQQHIPNTHSA